MKKIILLLVVFSTFFTSCRVTKTVTMWQAQENAKLTEEQFVLAKFDAIRFLDLSDEQKKDCATIFKTEKKGLLEINIKDNSSVAPVIYEAETKFRKVLTTTQLENYKAILHSYGNNAKQYFLTDNQLSEIKRIYDL